MLHFFTVCKSTCLGVLQILRGNECSTFGLIPLWQPFSSCVRLYKCACSPKSLLDAESAVIKCVNRGCYMNDCLLLNLLNELGKSDKMLGLHFCFVFLLLIVLFGICMYHLNHFNFHIPNILVLWLCSRTVSLFSLSTARNTILRIFLFVAGHA